MRAMFAVFHSIQIEQIHDAITKRARLRLQQVAEVKVLLVGHVGQTILAVHFCTSLVEVAFHGVVDEVPGKTSRLTLISLLLLHPRDEEYLSDNDTP